MEAQLITGEVITGAGSWPRRAMRALTLAATFAAAGATGAAAQAIDCNRLALQIASAGRDSTAGRYAAAAQKQAAELARTSAYARSIGCDRVQFLFFGSPRPPQCDGLNAQIARMQGNLAQLQRAAYGGGSLKQQLQQQYDAYCRPRRGILEELFGTDRREYPPAEVPDETQDAQDAEERATPRGGSYAVCVRTCDGGYFPVSYSASRASLSDLQEQCSALCPNTEARIYTRPLGGDMKSAVSADGEAYVNLANAFKFEKTYDATCTCKPKDKSWAQALAGAEQLIEGRKGDIAVTPALAEEMSKPQAPGAKKKATKFDAEAARRVLEQKRASEATGETANAAPPPAPPEDDAGPHDNFGPGALSPSRRPAGPRL